MLETLSFVEDEHPLLSRFSIETFKEFVESAKPPRLVANLTEIDLGAVSVDVIRADRNRRRHSGLLPRGRSRPEDDPGVDGLPLGGHHQPRRAEKSNLDAPLLRSGLVRQGYGRLPFGRGDCKME